MEMAWYGLELQTADGTNERMPPERKKTGEWR
jgi:hypothetical protein